MIYTKRKNPVNTARKMEEFNEKQKWIMQHALEIFATKGFEGASVRDISKAANINISMISYYFGSKEKLLEAIVQEYTDEMRERLSAIAFSEATNPSEKMTQIVNHYVDVFSKQSKFRSILHNEIKTMDQSSPIYRMVRDMKLQNKALLTQTIQDGQKTGEFRNDIDISMLVYSIVGVLNYIVSNKPFICEDNRIDPADDKAFEDLILKRAAKHLKESILALITSNQK